MNRIWPLLIPTKGRAGKSALLADLEKKKLAGTGLGVILFVEPQDVAAYERAYPHLQLIPLALSGKGLPYVRNAITRHAVNAGINWYWMLDDDVTGWHKRSVRWNDRRLVKATMEECLLAAQDLRRNSKLDVVQIALEYQQYAWAAPRRTRTNSYADVVVAVDARMAMNIGGFRPETDLKVDRDFTMRLIAGGYDVVRLCTHAFSTVKNGSNEGGCHDQYAENGREAGSSRTLAALWPWCVKTQTKPGGRFDAKIEWAKIRQAPRDADRIS